MEVCRLPLVSADWPWLWALWALPILVPWAACANDGNVQNMLYILARCRGHGLALCQDQTMCILKRCECPFTVIRELAFFLSSVLRKGASMMISMLGLIVLVTANVVKSWFSLVSFPSVQTQFKCQLLARRWAQTNWN